MITNSHLLYAWLEPLLGPFERAGTPREAEEQEMSTTDRYDVLLFGLGRFGGAIAQRLRARGLRVLGVDFNPAVVRRWHTEGLEAIYGDATDPEFVAHLPLAGVEWAVSTVPEHETGIVRDDSRVALTHALRDLNFPGRIAITSNRKEDWDMIPINVGMISNSRRII